MARALMTIVVALGLATPAGCRCQSGMEGTTSPAAEAAADRISSNAPIRWCRACATSGFTACKRVDGQQDEQTLRRKAELAACEDVGIPEAECADTVLSHVKCGTMAPSQ